jgi:hypothetical protein
MSQDPEDKPGCFGHGVTDTKNQGQSAQPSWAAVSGGLREMAGLPVQEEEFSAREPVPASLGITRTLQRR